MKAACFELTATRPEIAARLGSVREVVSRSLAHLQERGLIQGPGPSSYGCKTLSRFADSA